MKINQITERSKQVKASDPLPKLSKPTTGREQPHPYTGMLVGSKTNEKDDTGMYNPEINFKTAGGKQAQNKDNTQASQGQHFGIGNFFAWAMQKYPKLPLGMLKDPTKMAALEREYGQEKAMRRAEPNRKPSVSPAFDNQDEYMKMKGLKDSVQYPLFIPFNECPKCRGTIVHESQVNEKQDACYHKVKSRYKVWPSAYASGALVKCRKVGAKNWGNSSKKKKKKSKK